MGTQQVLKCNKLVPLPVRWGSRNSRTILLLPLWNLRPVQSLSACTTVHFNFTNTSTPPIGRMAFTEPQCLYNGALYLYLYLYSPYGLYSLYRASVPVQRCTLPLPIPLLPLWTVQPVQSLSACTTVHLIQVDTEHHLTLHLSTKESVEIIMLQLLYCHKRTPCTYWKGSWVGPNSW